MATAIRVRPRALRGRTRALAGLLVLAALVGALPSARAADDPGGYANGTASASAIVTRFTPGVGSLPTGLFGGVALADVTNKIARAQAETLDLGLIGDLLTALSLVPGDQLPSPLEIDNRAGPASGQADEVPIAGTTFGGGHKAVAVDAVPSARATSSLVSSFGDVVSVQGGLAEATTRVVSAGTREAEASVSADLDLLGLVHLRGLRWEAVHRTGRSQAAEGHFSIDAGAIGDVPLPLDALADVEDVVNQALAPLGVSITLPKVEHRTAPTDVVRVTPLEVKLADSPAGKAALGPVLGLTREQREELFDQLTTAYAPLGAPLLAADVASSIVSGTGFVSIEVGGVEASSGATAGPPPTPATPAAAPRSGPVPTLPPLAGGGAAPAAPAGPGLDVGSVGLRAACESQHLLHPVGCSSGSLVPLGLAGLAVVVAVAAADLEHQRRRRAHAAVPAGSGPTAAVVTLAAAGRRTARGYLPLAVASLAVLVLAATVGVPRGHARFDPAAVAPVIRTPVTTPDGAPVAGALDPGSGGGGPAAAPGSAAGVTPCADRAVQVPGDPYSPPCFAFRGDNGGATAHGVTRDTITVAVRDVDDGSAADIFAGLANQDIEASEASALDTLDALAQYFSDHFQMYGRRIKIARYRGTGNGINELLGGGKEQALADAVRAAKELGAFADVSAISLPYADALSRNGVVNIGAPYPSRAWFEERQPYAWSPFPDGTNVASATTSAIVGRYPPGSIAEHAGPTLRGRPRRFAIVAPENAEYQESINVLIRQLRAARIDVASNQKYKLDLVSFPNQASNIIAQLKDQGVTSVVCMCDPAMLAFGLTPKANEQGYEPEWITAGLVFVDQDVVAQTIDRTQWSHAFGTAYNAESERIRGSFPYFAYKSVRPDDEPAGGVEELYYQLYLLAIGIQMAGPHLTPATFQQGMFAYPGAFGPRGTWDFGPGDHTPTNDYREIWWDPDRISTQDDRPGAWVQLGGGRRWSPQDPPRGRAPFFTEG